LQRILSMDKPYVPIPHPAAIRPDSSRIRHGAAGGGAAAGRPILVHYGSARAAVRSILGTARGKKKAEPVGSAENPPKEEVSEDYARRC